MHTKSGHEFVAEKGVMVLMSSEYDRLFKELITEGWCVKSDGHVESPQGYFAVTEIPSDKGELTEMGNAMGWFENEPIPAAGWYFSVEENSGLIFVYAMRSEAEALSIFDKTAAEYAKWDEF